jgi:hypothetical protein
VRTGGEREVGEEGAELEELEMVEEEAGWASMESMVRLRVGVKWISFFPLSHRTHSIH